METIRPYLRQRSRSWSPSCCSNLVRHNQWSTHNGTPSLYSLAEASELEPTLLHQSECCQSKENQQREPHPSIPSPEGTELEPFLLHQSGWCKPHGKAMITILVHTYPRGVRVGAPPAAPVWVMQNQRKTHENRTRPYPSEGSTLEPFLSHQSRCYEKDWKTKEIIPVHAISRGVRTRTPLMHSSGYCKTKRTPQRDLMNRGEDTATPHPLGWGPSMDNIGARGGRLCI
jgi:hypothetical protein